MFVELKIAQRYNEILHGIADDRNTLKKSAVLIAGQ
jgi:hypothetical protein